MEKELTNTIEDSEAASQRQGGAGRRGRASMWRAPRLSALRLLHTTSASVRQASWLYIMGPRGGRRP